LCIYIFVFLCNIDVGGYIFVSIPLYYYNIELLVFIECLLLFVSELTLIYFQYIFTHCWCSCTLPIWSAPDTSFYPCHVNLFLSRRMWSSTRYRFPKTMCRHLFYWIIVNCHRLGSCFLRFPPMDLKYCFQIVTL